MALGGIKRGGATASTCGVCAGGRIFGFLWLLCSEVATFVFSVIIRNLLRRDS